MSDAPDPSVIAEWEGFCPICRSPTMFRAADPWFRDHLMCTRCPAGSVPRERALMLVLERFRPNWRSLRIHESSPAPRGVSALLARECLEYIATQFFPEIPGGQVHRGYRCENIEAQGFADESFDVVVTQDVMEHVFHPNQAYREIYRTLCPGGLYIHTVPIYTEMEHMQKCAILADDGNVVHLATPEYHGNPVDESGALVTHRYGRDLADLISDWTSFSVEITRFNDRYHGIVGAFTEVVVCQKTEGANVGGQHEWLEKQARDISKAQELSREQAVLGKKYKELSEEHQELQLSLANVLNSRSWRFTEPLRRAMRLLKRSE